MSEVAKVPGGPRPPSAAARSIAAAVAGVIRGKDDVIRATVVALAAQGHLLLEDVPGVGKTTLARALARAVGGTFQRIQFTSDLLPGDVVGVSVFDASTNEFKFRPGPVFAHVVLADEINRATPKTQSALLEAMAEGSVTVDGTRHTLPQPFLVVATQNPAEHTGTYPLPESQLDRFMLRVRVGYPSAEAERELLRDGRPESRVNDVGTVVDADALAKLQAAADQVDVHDDIVDYVQRLAAATRDVDAVELGASPRAALHLLRAARALALFADRDFVLPDDVKELAVAALAHRLVVRGGENAERVIEEILEEVRVPQ